MQGFMNPAVAYVRVSSRAQDQGMQLEAINRAASARGDEIFAVYSEKKKGDTLERPALTKLREDAKAGKVPRLYVYRLDRLTRSGIRDTIEVVQELRRHGVSVVTIADGFNVDGPEAELVMCVLAWVAENERRVINERISASREHMAAEGRAWGRPSRMTEQLVTKARALLAAGRSTRQISVALKIPHATIARALRKARKESPVYEFADGARVKAAPGLPVLKGHAPGPLQRPKLIGPRAKVKKR
jgi:DNA invertase Pin-like site-specific DNA recombinase